MNGEAFFMINEIKRFELSDGVIAVWCLFWSVHPGADSHLCNQLCVFPTAGAGHILYRKNGHNLSGNAVFKRIYGYDWQISEHYVPYGRQYKTVHHRKCGNAVFLKNVLPGGCVYKPIL